MLSALTGQNASTNVGNNQQQQQQQQQNPLGGFNIGGLMSMFGGMMNPQANNTRPQQQPTQQPNFTAQTQSTNQQQATQQSPHVHGPGCNHQQQQPQQSTQQQPQQQMPQFDLGNLANMASMLLNPQAQSNQPQTSSSTQPAQNPMGGLMGIFNSLQQSGGMGELMNMSLGDTLE